MKRRSVLISPEILRWRPHMPGGTILPDIDKRRAYDHLRRAEHFLTLSVVGEADLADCLGNLRRALTHRAQLLERLYKLRSPLQIGAKKHFLELLAQVGIVRPSFLHSLLEARNSVEYRDRKPPSKKRCQEMADSVWYFLRSTDNLVLTRRDDFQLTPCEDGYPTEVYWLTFRMTYSSRFRMEISGWVPADLVSLKPAADWFEILADDFGTKKERWPNDPNRAEMKDEDYWIRGVVAPNVRTVSSLLTLAFESE